LKGDVLTKRLACFVHMNAEDRQIIQKLCNGPVKRVEAKADVIRQGESLPTAGLLQKGWACRYMTLTDGRRQIIGFLVPGDVFNIEMPGVRLDHSIGAITDCELLSFGNPIFGPLRSHPNVARALAIHRHVSNSILRNWVLNLGQRNALERIGNVFCELLIRLRCVGLTDDDAMFHFPVTQLELAEATGLTAVHVNRTLQDMRARKLVTVQNRELRILDFERLADLVMFDGTHLHPTLTECTSDG
jgi:CRP-like cAMP-binding protein